jgi:ribosomal protein L14
MARTTTSTRLADMNLAELVDELRDRKFMRIVSLAPEVI